MSSLSKNTAAFLVSTVVVIAVAYLINSMFLYEGKYLDATEFKLPQSLLKDLSAIYCLETVKDIDQSQKFTTTNLYEYINTNPLNRDVIIFAKQNKSIDLHNVRAIKAGYAIMLERLADCTSILYWYNKTTYLPSDLKEKSKLDFLINGLLYSNEWKEKNAKYELSNSSSNFEFLKEYLYHQILFEKPDPLILNYWKNYISKQKNTLLARQKVIEHAILEAVTYKRPTNFCKKYPYFFPKNISEICVANNVRSNNI